MAASSSASAAWLLGRKNVKTQTPPNHQTFHNIQRTEESQIIRLCLMSKSKHTHTHLETPRFPGRENPFHQRRMDARGREGQRQRAESRKQKRSRARESEQHSDRSRNRQKQSCHKQAVFVERLIKVGSTGEND